MNFLAICKIMVKNGFSILTKRVAENREESPIVNRQKVDFPQLLELHQKKFLRYTKAL
eukprot:UN00286